MTNLLSYIFIEQEVLMNRKPKTIKYTGHVLERMAQRGVKKLDVQKCVDFGVKTKIHNTVHYIFEDLTVVLGNSDVTVVTTYWKQEEEIEIEKQIHDETDAEAV
jgi:imidazoleglycerol phosphate dehydratase HisB